MKGISALLLVCWLLAAQALGAQIPSPREHFGFAIGDDYQLANYTQTEAYLKKLAAISDRVRLVDIGATEEGRTQWMLVISAPENLRSLARHKEISARLARADDLTEDEARAFAQEGKAVVWIDGGLHANETVSSHQLIETAWQLVSSTDAETERILRDTIVLCAHANPDGQELVASWYMREPDPTRRVLTATPRPYNKYIGHDNNRDFFLSAMKETTNINRQLYLEWFPQIVYNHHQTAPTGTVMFTPPFRDPFNYVFDPLVVNGIQALGTAIQGRLLQEGKSGATSRSGADYSTWFNGSLRTTSYFHNMIGLLTEVAGGPTPMQIPLIARRQLPSSDLLAPIEPQVWRFRQAIDYSLTANRAVLDYAARNREQLLFNIYRMGRNAIERGSRDHWTPRPSRIEEIERLARQERVGLYSGDGESGNTTGSAQRLGSRYWQLLHRPEWRDPRGFIVPADQPDFPTAVKFINALVKNGIAIHQATAPFSVGGKNYPAGSYVVKSAQAFRPHVLDMFEPQDHPNDFRSPGGLPNRPYDVAGWTLAFQMGIVFDRILDEFVGPFVRLPYGELQKPPAARFAAAATRAGFLVSPQTNDSAILVNRLLRSGARVFRLKNAHAEAAAWGAGAFFIPEEGDARMLVETAAAEFGLPVRALAVAPATDECLQLHPMRIALWDRLGGSSPSGWTRWLLEQFEFPFEVVYAPEIDARQLRGRYDALILVHGAIPPPGTRPPPEPRPRNLPPEYESRIGSLTPERSIPALREFLETGGSIVTIGSSTNLAYQLGLPLQSALTERGADGTLRHLTEEAFFVPGSVLEVSVDTAHPLAWGMSPRADVYFERSPAFRIPSEFAAGGIEKVAWFDNEKPLRSGWAWGQHHLKDSLAVAVARVGGGRLYVMGPEVAFRGQTHGTFKLLFNALYLATARTNGATAESTPASPSARRVRE